MKNSIVYIQTITNLHIGSGEGLGVIDMPVQRERITGYPVIPSSSLKGVLRSKYNKANEKMIFGNKNDEKDPDEKDQVEAGGLCFFDGRLLFYPVRSLKGTYLLITCPAVLNRFARDAKAVEKEISMPSFALSSGQIITDNKECLISPSEEKKVVLEEFPFAKTDGDLSGLKKLFPALGDKIAVLSDDDFSYFAKNASEVYARIAIEKETKIVKDGALFYQEFVPAETVFYSMIAVNDSKHSAKAGLETVELQEILPGYVQLGGNETIGKGLCKTYIDKLK